MILTFLVGEAPASPLISFCTLSAIPLNIVEPPDKTILAYISFLMSSLHFTMDSNTS